MLKIFTVCFAALGFGAMLSFNALHLPIRPGYIGAILLVAGAFWVKQYWYRREITAGDEPNPSERNVWLWMVGTALICGFVLAVLFQPGSEVHSKTGDTGGIDSWLMLASILIAYSILRDRIVQPDERDTTIAHFGTKAAYFTLIILLIILLLTLGFAPGYLMQRFTHWLIANLLITLIMLSCLVQYIAQLICYWSDVRNLKSEL